jgi:hypothetical protein
MDAASKKMPQQVLLLSHLRWHSALLRLVVSPVAGPVANVRASGPKLLPVVSHTAALPVGTLQVA